jgi:hypothetical protein
MAFSVPDSDGIILDFLKESEIKEDKIWPGV